VCLGPPRGVEAHEGESTMSYDELVGEARRLLREAIDARYRGDLHATKVRRLSYADGYMKALTDAGLLSHRELLELVAQARSEQASQEPPARIATAS
jgi:hypothetical protein